VDSPQGNHDLTYDTATGRLTRALSRDGQQIDWGYDGSLLIRADWTGPVAASVIYGYEDDLRVSQLDYRGMSLSVTYDADGRLHQLIEGSAATTFHYNAGGTLGAVELPDDRQITYLYDHRGRRVARAVGEVRTHLWLCGQTLSPLAEYDG
jgi:YD repeat-containing protein